MLLVCVKQTLHLFINIFSWTQLCLSWLGAQRQRLDGLCKPPAPQRLSESLRPVTSNGRLGLFMHREGTGPPQKDTSQSLALSTDKRTRLGDISPLIHPSVFPVHLRPATSDLPPLCVYLEVSWLGTAPSACSQSLPCPPQGQSLLFHLLF